jgi:hypothetical protein
MRCKFWVIGACLGLLLVGGLAMDVSAQQSAAPAPLAPAETRPDATQPSPPSLATPPSGQVQQAPSTERSKAVVERDAEGSKILGVDPMVALIVGTVLLVLVAMSRPIDEVNTHTHHRA